MTACQDLALLLTLRATGDLDAAEAARVEEHLAGCAACRAEAEQDAAVLRLARLPAPTDGERRATASLARGTLAELHRREGRLSSWKRAAAGFAAAAAVLVAVLAPAMLGKKASYPPPELAADAAASAPAAAGATESWEPDLDTLWSDTGILDVEASAATDATYAYADDADSF